MATSSITANFRIKDPKSANDFVRALCDVESDSVHSSGHRSSVRAEYISGREAIRDFFRRG